MKRIRSALCGVLTVAVGIGAARHYSHDREGQTSAPTPRLVDLPVGGIEWEAMPLNDAVAELTRRTHVPIVNQLVPRYSGNNQERTLNISAADATFGQALDAIVRETDYRASYDERNGIVTLASRTNLPRSLKMYDVSDLVADGVDPTEAPLVTILQRCIDLRSWEWYEADKDRPNKMTLSSGRLIVLQSMANLEGIERFLFALRNARPDGTGPFLPEMAVMPGYRPSAQPTELRFYDVRDIIDRAAFNPALLPAKRRRLFSAQRITRGAALLRLAMYARHDLDKHSSGIWPSCGDCGYEACVAKRLVIVEIPAVHESLRRTLADIRAGRPVPGLEAGKEPR